MRKGSYITIVICVVLLSSGSAPVWLCVRADGHIGLKANAETSCELACSDHQDEDTSIAITVSDDCCLDIPIGLGGALQLTKPVRAKKAELSQVLMCRTKLCAGSVPTAAEFGLVTRPRSPGSCDPPDMIRAVVLLI